MTPPRSRGGTPRASRRRPWPGYSAQKNYAASRAVARLDPLARRRRARHAGARGGDPVAARDRAAAPRLPRSPHQPLPRTLDPRDRLVSRLPAAPLRPPRRRVERPARPRVGAPRKRRARTAHARPAALPLPRHQPPPRDDRPLHDARRRADGGGRARRRRSPASRCIRRSRFSGTTSCAAASGTAAPASSSRS